MPTALAGRLYRAADCLQRLAMVAASQSMFPTPSDRAALADARVVALSAVAALVSSDSCGPAFEASYVAVPLVRALQRPDLPDIEALMAWSQGVRGLAFRWRKPSVPALSAVREAPQLPASTRCLECGRSCDCPPTSER